MTYRSIALSGLPGAGKTTLMETLAKRLNWEVYYIGGEFRKRYQTWVDSKQKSDAMFGTVSFEKWWASFVSDDDIQDINKFGKSLLERGNIILDSRYAPVNALGVNDCLVAFIEADLIIRARRALNTGKYPELDERGIQRKLKAREDDEVFRGKGNYRSYFNGEFDYRDKKHYGLVLDSGRVSVEEEVEAVLAKLNS